MEQTVIQKMKKKFTMSWLSLTFLVILIVYAIILFAIMLWGFLSSVQTVDYFNNVNKVQPETFAPWDWQFVNYVRVFLTFQVRIKGVPMYIEQMFLNSVLYAVVGAFLHAAVACLMAYLSAKFKYKVSSVIYWLVVFTMTIPIVGADISNIQLLDTLGLYDTFFGAWLLKFSFTGTYFLVFHATFTRLPNDYAEAAYIDGAGETTVFLKILFPMISSTFFTIFLLYLISLWNDYQVPLLYLPTHPTLSYGVQSLTGGGSNSVKLGNVEVDYASVPIKLTTCFLVAIPIMIVFILFRKRIMNKLDMGGIKE